jgi:hypothetical protein
MIVMRVISISPYSPPANDNSVPWSISALLARWPTDRPYARP